MRISNNLTRLFAAGLMAVLALPASAADKPKAKETVCNTDSHFRDFDFWLGHWAVTDSSSGKEAGTNRIYAVDNGCAVMESWHGKGGSQGRSVNYYNPMTGKWRQTWVSNGAYSLEIEGGLNDQGQMAMTGTIWYYQTKQTAPFRGVWTPNKDGSVRQYFEQYDAEKKAWQPWFDGHYVKITKEQKHRKAKAKADQPHR